MSQRDSSRLRARLRLRYWVAFCAVISLTASGVFAQTNDAPFPADLNVVISSQQVQIAEPFRLRVDCRVNEQVQVKFPELGKRWGRFDIISQADRFDIPDTDGRRLWSRELVLETLETGDLQTPAMEVLATHDGATRRLVAAPQSVTVESVLEPNADISKIRDIKPIIESPESSNQGQAYSWWIAATALMLAMACCVLFWRRRQVITPREWAIRELAELDAHDAQPGEIFEQLTDIVARYLYWQFELDTPSWTTADMLQSPEVIAHLSESDMEEAQALLEMADRVKYAAVQPTEAESMEAIQRCQAFVERLDDAWIDAGAEPAPSNTNP